MPGLGASFSHPATPSSLRVTRRAPLKLAQDDNYQVAIFDAPGPSSASLELMRELRDTVPKMIVLAERSVDIERLRRSLPTVDEFLLTSASEGALTARVGELIGRTDSTACRRSRPAPGTRYASRTVGLT